MHAHLIYPRWWSETGWTVIKLDDVIHTLEDA